MPERLRFVDDAVVDISEIENVSDLEPLELEVSPQNVAENERSEIADVGKVPHRRPADIKADLVGLDRAEFLYLSRKRVKKSQHKTSPEKSQDTTRLLVTRNIRY
jgi:hypothetical protein